MSLKYDTFHFWYLVGEKKKKEDTLWSNVCPKLIDNICRHHKCTCVFAELVVVLVLWLHNLQT